MLPPIDPRVLSANPQFYILYRDLCTVKLNLDGSSTLDQKTQKERDVFATVSEDRGVANLRSGVLVLVSSRKLGIDIVSVGLEHRQTPGGETRPDQIGTTKSHIQSRCSPRRGRGVIRMPETTLG
jgi:hypothetical protein